MAKQKDVNKSAEIRALLAKDPNAQVKDISAALAQRGIKVSNNLVYLIKSKSNKKARRAKRDKAIAASEHAGMSNPVELILQVRQLAAKAGGVKRLKSLVDVLAE